MLTLSIVVLAGCKAIIGVDFNQALKNSLKVTSSEGNSSLAFKLHLNEDVLANEADEQYVEMLRLLSDVKLSIKDMKMQDETTVSFKGNLSLADETSIDFGMKMNEELLIVSLEGAPKSFSFDLTGKTAIQLENEYYYGYDYEQDEDYETEYAVEDEALIAAINEVTNVITNYTIDKLPNVERVSVKPVVESINGVDTSLVHVHGELKGMELWQWAKKLIDGLLADRDSLEKMLTEVISILTKEPATYDTLFGLYFEDESDVEFDETDKANLTKEAVEDILVFLDELKQGMLEIEVEDKESLEQLLNDSLNINFDYYVDSNIDIRKQKLAIDYTLAEEYLNVENEIPFTGFSLVSEGESWNVNGNIAADKAEINSYTVSLESLYYKEGYEILNYFDEDSFIYDFLKNTVGISEQYYWNFVYEDDPFGMYINDKNVAMVPIADLVYYFDGELSYDQATKQITYLDIPTGKKIVMTIGSDIVTIDGVAVQWAAPVVSREGVSYAPLRGISEALGAELYWDATDNTVELTRIP